MIASECSMDDPRRAIGFEFEPKTLTYDERDVSLYALSVGAAADPLDVSDLAFVYELAGSGLRVLPTFAVTLGLSVLWQLSAAPGMRFNPALLLHGEQYLHVPRPLPLAATVTNRARVAQVYDKGSGALVLLDVHSEDASGTPVAFNQVSVFIRGLGGFGGERGPSNATEVPGDRPPDAVYRQRIPENQALLYRLTSGDRNPLHADPAFAAAGGFPRPILHGLCSFGYAVRAVLRTFAGNDPGRFRSARTRFSRHVFPGETLVTEMWRDEGVADGLSRVLFRCRVAERDEIVLTNAAVELAGE
jgi:3-hydroxyacyl-CoA dehydrogenase/3a,7a,12a-trihydroxy-5b-cholest-24-enoyl-CoA hydratase